MYSASELAAQIEALESRILKLEGGVGYECKCKCCGVLLPANWLTYEIDKDGKWIGPCCAICARENKSRGPLPAIRR